MLVPLPHLKDCRNTTEIANRRGFAKHKAPRFFFAKLSSSNKSFVYGKCNLTKKLAVGFYVNHCTAYNSELNTTGSCTYSVTVRANSCPQLPDIPHAVLKCNNKDNTTFPKRTICNYVCDEGYVIPTKLKKFSRKTCTPKKLIWQPDGVPSCKRAEPPTPKRHSCIYQTLFLDSDKTTVKLKLPRFRSYLKGGKVKVRCLLHGSLSAGNYTNKCTAEDVQLGLISSCEYNITVQAKGCSALTNVTFGSLNCSAPAINGRFPIGTFCNYKCNIGTVFPSILLQYSIKSCIDHELWNSSVIPSCVALTPPTPESDSCLNQTIEIKDLESFQIIPPKFKSAIEALVEVDCSPQNISTYDVHNISCTAFDTELRVSSSCSFQVDVQNPNGIEELSREEISCESLKDIENGVIECWYSESKLYAPGTLCEAICDEGFIVPLSKRNSSLALCLASGQWNASHISDCVKTEAPVLVHGCKNDTISINNLSHINVSLPLFVIEQNTAAIVSCTPAMLVDYGQYEISCTALDKELNTSASCHFFVNIINIESEEVTNIPTTVFESPLSTTTEKAFKSCEKIIVPNRGTINCTSDKPTKHCSVGCVEGYGFSSKHKTLRNGIITCDGSDGLWDFQRDLNSTKLPECLGHLPNTSVVVWMSFSAEVRNCDIVLEDDHLSTIKASVIGINEKMCEVVDCTSRLNIDCSVDLAENKTNIVANWTLQTAFKHPGPTEIPAYEENIEMILDTTHKAINSASEWKRNLSLSGIEVLEDSFKRGKIILECDEDGYGVDYLTDKCVECPPGFFENQNVCKPCPSGQFQLKSGQTSCDLCSDYTTSNTAVPASCSDTLFNAWSE